MGVVLQAFGTSEYCTWSATCIREPEETDKRVRNGERLIDEEQTELTYARVALTGCIFINATCLVASLPTQPKEHVSSIYYNVMLV